MTGRPQFENVTAIAPRESLKVTKLTSDTIILPNGGTENIDVYAPSGTVGKLQSLNLTVPVVHAAALGTHELNVTSTALAGGYTYGRSNANKLIHFNWCQWHSTDVESYPVDPAVMVRGILFDDVTGIRFAYKNDTDTGQAGQRSFNITWIEYLTAE